MTIITHVGNFEFSILLEDGQTLPTGPNYINVIKFTYFEDGEVPEIGWNVTHQQLLKDFHIKYFTT